MPHKSTKPRTRHGHRTIILPITEEQYAEIVENPQRFRAEWLEPFFATCPELFPPGFDHGYEMNGHYIGKRLKLKIRRIKLRNGDQYQVRPAFALPMMVGKVQDVEAGLFFRKFGVPYWAIARVFGRNATFWYRLEIGLGRNSIVGTAVKTVPIPEDLLADEHHEKINGEKIYLATTGGSGVVLGAEAVASASTEDLQQGYGVFKEEALAVDPEYAPSTVNTDGWSGTIAAWKALFPMIVLIRCFLHAWLKIRERGKKLENFFELGDKVWGVYYSTTRRMMSQRILRLSDWAKKSLSGIVLAKALDLCNKKSEWSLWYDNESAYLTSNELDRLMRSQNRYFDRGQHFHGSLGAANLRSRSWAVLYNYWDWSPSAVRSNGGARCPAERLNGKRYADCWLENLLVATSLGGTKNTTLKVRNN